MIRNSLLTLRFMNASTWLNRKLTLLLTSESFLSFSAWFWDCCKFDCIYIGYLPCCFRFNWMVIVECYLARRCKLVQSTGVIDCTRGLLVFDGRTRNQTSTVILWFCNLIFEMKICNLWNEPLAVGSIYLQSIYNNNKKNSMHMKFLCKQHKHSNLKLNFLPISSYRGSFKLL